MVEDPYLIPKNGEVIIWSDGFLDVPFRPIIPYIRGDGIGVDITPVMQKVIDAAVEKAYDGERYIAWMKLLAGDEALEANRINKANLNSVPLTEQQELYLPKKTVEMIKKYLVAIKGPLSTPVGGGIRSLNVTLRQTLDLYACVRPARWYQGVPAPLKNPERLNVVIFRENTEDVYAGIEWAEGTEDVKQVMDFVNKEMGITIREDSAIGIKPVSITATKRLVRAAIAYALKHGKRNVTLVHKGNIMKFTEGAFRKWGYEVAVEEFRESIVTEREYGPLSIKSKHPDLSGEEMVVRLSESGWYDFTSEEVKSILNTLLLTHGGKNLGSKLIIKDRIADQMFQQILLRPSEYDVIATLNLNGDYLSDACAAAVGGLGIAPGANINYETSVALFEATHGTAPKYAGLDMVNPSSLILSAVLLLQYLGWTKASEMVEIALVKTILNKTVTYDLHRQMKDATKLSTSQFGDAIIKEL